ncbi:SEC-C domain-containing protein, partial [Candidatus Curtissbacteria bacterium]|nr:SEC-C domain-containing protein [Candidatus Curtissbacteria bacterium]
AEFSTIIPFDDASLNKLKTDAPKNPEDLAKFLKEVIGQVWDGRNKNLGETVARDIEKFASLSVIDTLWISHLDALDDLREGIGLRAAGQRDPLVEYKQEAFTLFEKLVSSIDYEIVHRIFKVQVQNQPTIATTEQKGTEIHEEPTLKQEVTEVENNIDPLALSDDELEKEIKRLESEQGQQSSGTDSATDPMEMTDEELDKEIARLEAVGKGEVITSTNPMLSKSGSSSLKIQKIGRNDPCPCGSGLKYKKCGLINAPEHKS